MLSKIAFFRTDERPDIAADRARLLPALRQRLQSLGRSATITPAGGGTLGACYDADILGERRFLKTHLPGRRARDGLAREADALEHIYGNMILLERIEIPLADGTSRLCLMMPALTALPGPLAPNDAAAMADACREHLEHWRPAGVASLQDYLAPAAEALKTLSSRRLLDASSAAEVRRLVALLDDRLADLPEAICHGDFGPKNIMLQEGAMRVIDWEDAFRGIAGYDYLYWLTFMENRPFLKKDAFGRTGLSPDVERAILTLVVLLKSYLAVLSGEHLKQAMSAQARIAEILELPH